DRHGRWVRDAVDALVPSRRAASKRTAKSCGPDISTLISSRRMIRRRWWQESPIARESTKETVKTIRVRECRVVRQYLLRRPGVRRDDNEEPAFAWDARVLACRPRRKIENLR